MGFKRAPSSWAPCLPSNTDKLPSGSEWLREIKHDGFRIIARKNGSRVRLYSTALAGLSVRRGRAASGVR
jgi:ATP-dependent DNA ligase